MVLAHLINIGYPGCPQRSIKNYTIILKKRQFKDKRTKYANKMLNDLSNLIWKDGWKKWYVYEAYKSNNLNRNIYKCEFLLLFMD